MFYLLKHISIFARKLVMSGLYIHIPFCASRCIYCDFYSTVSLSLRDSYVDALCHEMILRQNEIHKDGENIKTIYLGGGTPSQLTNKELNHLFYYINKVWPSIDYTSSDMEITMECNPDDMTPTFIKNLKLLPVNRISMGVQTFSNKRLEFLHRRHNAKEVTNAIKNLKDAGFKNISIDLMFGFPNEALEDWQEDLDKAIQLDITHISAYSLMYEEGTPLYLLLKKGKIQEIDEEISLRMYEILIDKLTSNGYEHYEISNFALPGYQSIHNSNYWHNIPYIGFGAAAHSYDLKTRRCNIANLHKYIHAINTDQISQEIEIIDERTHYNDLITTALRTSEGLNVSELSEEYQTFLLDNAAKFLEKGLLRFHNDHLSLTRNGIFISDNIMSNLIKI
jgi:putative oxygen-independent coproporphyrinogen III oxidase